jgi:hypothetical protein
MEVPDKGDAMKELCTMDQLLEDGRQFGELTTRRADILTALEIRFGKATAKQFAPGLEAVKNSSELTRLFRLVLQSSRIEEFRDWCFLPIHLPKRPASRPRRHRATNAKRR